MLQGGVDLSYLQWKAYDGVGRNVRNGLNFVERGFGPRAALSCSDRGHTAISQMKPADVDFHKLFASDGARWLHTGGIFCALGPETPAVAKAAMKRRRRTTCASPTISTIGIRSGVRSVALPKRKR